MNKFLTTEPALVIGAVTAVLVLLTAFGIQVTPEQSAAVVGAVSAFLVLAAALITRQTVTPNAKVAAREDTDGILVSGPADEGAENGAPVMVHYYDEG